MNDNENHSIINPYDWDKMLKQTKIFYAYIYIFPVQKLNCRLRNLMILKMIPFYLTHNEKGNYEFSGCIYSEKINSTDFH